MVRIFLILLTLAFAAPAAAQNSCDYANDNECDEARYGGQGYCDAGTDTADCSLVSAGISNDSCSFANDGECDEYRYGGGGACQDGSDTTDCGVWQVQRESDFMDRARALGIPPATIADLGDNTCRWANDDECDDVRYGGTGACDTGTDASDCLVNVDSTAAATPPTAGDNSCVFANDNECDEAQYGGGGFCDAGTDTNDCSASIASAPATPAGDNSCVFANDNECDEEQYGGAGFCEANTDTNDCAASIASVPVIPTGDNSCVFANDNECDEEQYGGAGFCAAGTDTNDCAASINATPAITGDNSCVFANDNECDEAQYGGGGFCDAGTDTNDCSANIGVPVTPTGDDSCVFANDGECDEAQYGGGGFCDPGTDVTDCSANLPNDDASNTDFDRLMDLVPANLRAQLGNDTCQYANDLECDDEDFGGTGACTEGTDASDCRALAMGGDNSCQWANDNECDEPIIGTNNCISGSDTADCGDARAFMNRDDTCITAFDGICNEAEGGDGTCTALTDTADCLGRSRPATLENHFFGRDNRLLVDHTQLPWRAIGSIDGGCTGTLVGPTLVLTAAHCIYEAGERITPEVFYAGESRGETMGEAKVLSAVHDPSYDDANAFQSASGGNGHDWALMVIDRPLGNELGFLPVHELSAAELSQIGRSGLIVNQAGYSWDTGDNLSGNIGCRIVAAFDDNSIQHECDTARGDSGSPFLYNIDGDWHIIGVDSHFFDAEGDKAPFARANRAVDSRAFAAAVAQQQ